MWKDFKRFEGKLDTCWHEPTSGSIFGKYGSVITIIDVDISKLVTVLECQGFNYFCSKDKYLASYTTFSDEPTLVRLKVYYCNPNSYSKGRFADKANHYMQLESLVYVGDSVVSSATLMYKSYKSKDIGMEDIINMITNMGLGDCLHPTSNDYIQIFQAISTNKQKYNTDISLYNLTTLFKNEYIIKKVLLVLYRKKYIDYRKESNMFYGNQFYYIPTSTGIESFNASRSKNN